MTCRIVIGSTFYNPSRIFKNRMLKKAQLDLVLRSKVAWRVDLNGPNINSLSCSQLCMDCISVHFWGKFRPKYRITGFPKLFPLKQWTSGKDSHHPMLDEVQMGRGLSVHLWEWRAKWETHSCHSSLRFCPCQKGECPCWKDFKWTSKKVSQLVTLFKSGKMVCSLNSQNDAHPILEGQSFCTAATSGFSDRKLSASGHLQRIVCWLVLQRHLSLQAKVRRIYIYR
jgi:hypothetical protein